MAPKRPRTGPDDLLDDEPDPDLDEVLDLDLDDEGPDEDDDLDLGIDSITDEPQLEDLDEPDSDDGLLPEIEELLAEEGPDDWELLDGDDRAPAPIPADRVVLPWSLRAEIPALALTLPAILDPTRPDSVWVVPKPPDREQVEVLVRLHGLEVRARLRLIVGDHPGLRLGRDVLGYTIVVGSTDA